MDSAQARDYVRTFIQSGCANPSIAIFNNDMRMLKDRILDELVAYCDELANNFISTFGDDAPGIKHCKVAKQIILQAKSG
jgi:hypothetical protein